MPITINDTAIPDSQVRVLLDLYVKQYSDYMARKAALDKEYQDMVPVLIALGILSDNEERKQEKKQDYALSERMQSIFSSIEMAMLFGNKYNPDWPWLRKSIYAIELAGTPLTSNEIVDVVKHFFEPETDRDKLMNSIPATLSVAFKEGKIIRQMNDKGEYEYKLK